MIRPCKEWKTAGFIFMFFINYILHSEVFYLTLCNTIASENDWIRVEIAGKTNIYLNFLSQDK